MRNGVVAAEERIFGGRVGEGGAGVGNQPHLYRSMPPGEKKINGVFKGQITSKRSDNGQGNPTPNLADQTRSDPTRVFNTP